MPPYAAQPSDIILVYNISTKITEVCSWNGQFQCENNPYAILTEDNAAQLKVAALVNIGIAIGPINIISRVWEGTTTAETQIMGLAHGVTLQTPIGGQNCAMKPAILKRPFKVIKTVIVNMNPMLV